MKLKPFVFPVLYISLIITLVVGLYFTTNLMQQETKEVMEDITYVSNTILGDVVPVINSDIVVSNPYQADGVKIIRYFYNIEDDVDKQKEAIIYYNNTYMPNTGLDYQSDNQFEIVSILDGVVIDIKEDEILGKIIEIKHDNELVSSYSGLSEISVQKGENVTIGQKIGMSGTNKLNNSLGNNLHLEIYQNGLNIDPSQVIGKKLGDF